MHELRGFFRLYSCHMQKLQQIREATEQRQFGAMFVCMRETKFGKYTPQKQVLFITDTAKTEISAGFFHWFRLQHLKTPAVITSFPAGGRAMSSEGVPETRIETIQNELLEELGVLLSLQTLAQGVVQQHPFIVAQLKNEQEKDSRVIHQFGVTSMLYHLDQLSLQDQQNISRKVVSGDAFWVSLQKLEACFNHLRTCGVLRELGIRPQAYTAAHLWWLQEVSQWSSEAIIADITIHNQQTHDFIRRQANTRQIPIKNGAFSDDGVALAPRELSSADAAFLYS